jgi:hypothetical protein
MTRTSESECGVLRGPLDAVHPKEVDREHYIIAFIFVEPFFFVLPRLSRNSLQMSVRAEAGHQSGADFKRTSVIRFASHRDA